MLTTDRLLVILVSEAARNGLESILGRPTEVEELLSALNNIETSAEMDGWLSALPEWAERAVKRQIHVMGIRLALEVKRATEVQVGA